MLAGRGLRELRGRLSLTGSQTSIVGRQDPNWSWGRHVGCMQVSEWAERGTCPPPRVSLVRDVVHHAVAFRELVVGGIEEGGVWILNVDLLPRLIG